MSPILDSWTEGLSIFVATEWYEGNLTDWLSSEYNDSDRARLEVCQQISSGITYLHGQGLTHGNLRPSNVLYKSTRTAGEFKVQLSDYGLERLFSRGAEDEWPVPEIVNGSAKDSLGESLVENHFFSPP